MVSRVNPTNRDLPVLLFLWKWRAAPLAVLSTKFYPTCSERTAYCRLNELRRARLLEVRPAIGNRVMYYILGRRGFEIVRDHVPDARAKTSHRAKREYLNVELAALTAAFHLGDWIMGEPEGVALFSNRDLESMQGDSAPSWLPYPLAHKPDGLWRIEKDGTSRTVALEVEDEPREARPLSRIERFYSESKEVDRVIWVLSRGVSLLRVHHVLPSGQTIETSKHNFCERREFLKSGWDAPILCGPDQGRRVIEVVAGIPHERPRNPADTFPCKLFFKNRRTPATLSSSDFRTATENRD